MKGNRIYILTPPSHSFLLPSASRPSSFLPAFWRLSLCLISGGFHFFFLEEVWLSLFCLLFDVGLGSYIMMIMSYAIRYDMDGYY